MILKKITGKRLSELSKTISTYAEIVAGPVPPFIFFNNYYNIISLIITLH